MDHSLLYEKNKITLCGVKGVPSFDEKEVTVTLNDNAVTFRGNGFVLIEMIKNEGKLSFSGNIGSIMYHSKQEKTGFFNKIFK